MCVLIRWSISVYGSDLFLVPNDAGVYSVNSFQLREAFEKLKNTKTTASSLTTDDGVLVQHDTPVLKIICSESNPFVSNADVNVAGELSCWYSMVVQ